MNKPLILGVVTALIGTALSVAPARAQDSSFVVTLLQEGPNVVANGSGTINSTDLHFIASSNREAVIFPFFADIFTGPSSSTLTGEYASVTGPRSFGVGSFTFASSGSGDTVGIFDGSRIFLPTDYVSDSPLMSTSTWDNATFSSLGVTPGTYEWKWGSGDDTGTFTLKAGAAAVPEPATLGLLVLGLLGAGFAGRKRQN
jgi:hypothetical protein